MRMHMRQFTRLTNASSKKFENHCHMVALYAAWYKFIRIHKTLRVTSAMEAGVTDRLFTYNRAMRMTRLLPASMILFLWPACSVFRPPLKP